MIQPVKNNQETKKQPKKKTNKIVSKFEKVFILSKKSFYIAWYRHHFIIPPRVIYKYAKSFFTFIKRGAGLSNLYTNQKKYKKWYQTHMPKLDSYKKLSYKPLFTFIVTTYNFNKKAITECIESLLTQSYKNFEIIVCDDASTNPETTETLKQFYNNKQIKVIFRKKNGGVSKATNEAISKSKGEFLVFVNGDNALHPDSLYYFANELNKDKNLDFIYSDEDKIDPEGNLMEPYFKPDFSPDTLMGFNYIEHSVCIKKTIVEKIGGFRAEYDGAQSYDLYLRTVDQTKNICHIDKVLYHSRLHNIDTADNQIQNDHDYDSGKKALIDTLKRKHTKGEILDNPYTKTYLTKYGHDNPKVSVILPTKDCVDVTKTCIESLYKVNTYKNFEIVIADNGSEKKETLDYFDQLKKNHNNVKIVRIEGEFNYSYINNKAIENASGDYVWLLNNDTEVVDPETLDWMVGYASQEHVGCVGTKLLYPNNLIQHAGVVLGHSGTAGHVYVSLNNDELGAFGRLKMPYNYTAVTAACLMIKKDKFNEIGCFDENLKVALNDVDLNLKTLDAGYYNVCLSNVWLYHYESRSRGYDASKEKHERYLAEQAYLKKKWGHTLDTDKFFSKYYF